MERARRVFITNRGGHNYSDAKRFGELVYMTEGRQNRFAVASIYRTFTEAMDGSSKSDYLLVTSMNVLNSIAAAIFARKHGCLNLLLFKEGRYEPREIDIDSLLYLDSKEIKDEVL